MQYLRNTWYMAAWDNEINQTDLFQRTLLDESVLLFRNSGGTVQAISNRCPHRFAPLHLGTRVGDNVQCPYHGLQFNGHGECVLNPHGDGKIPRAATVKSYPVIEKYSVVWIWMGNPAQADEAKIPDFGCLSAEDNFVAKRYLHVKANYVLETDNIMDLSHIQFMHASTIGSNSVAEGSTSVEQVGNTVRSNRSTVGETLPDFLYEVSGIPHGTVVDRWINVRWDAPAK